MRLLSEYHYFVYSTSFLYVSDYFWIRHLCCEIRMSAAKFLQIILLQSFVWNQWRLELCRRMMPSGWVRSRCEVFCIGFRLYVCWHWATVTRQIFSVRMNTRSYAGEISFDCKASSVVVRARMLITQQHYRCVFIQSAVICLHSRYMLPVLEALLSADC